MSTINLQFELTGDTLNYLETSARLRGISRTQLVRKTMEIILRDQLFLSILDDDDAPSVKTHISRGGPRVGSGRKGRAMPPKDRLFDALKRVPSVAMRRPMSFVKPEPKTKTEMIDELRQAVLNTGGELVK